MKQPDFKHLFIDVSARVLSFVLKIFRTLFPSNNGIYFCYNQSVHQIYHTLFIAIELSNIQQDIPVCVVSTSSDSTAIIERELAAIPNHVNFKKIYHSGYWRRKYCINMTMLLFRLILDKPRAVVVADYYDNVLRQLKIKTRWIFVPHGIANRAFAFDEHIQEYDLIFLPGKRDREEMEQRIGHLSQSHEMGYSKFDYFHYHPESQAGEKSFQKPRLLYNPHFEPKLSSFFLHGIEFISRLVNSGRYDVMFLPHPDLARRWPKLVKQAFDVDGVIQTDHLTPNLAYMNQADIYITDASSSAFEWLYFDRPVVYFYPNKNSEAELPSFDFGPVANSCDQAIQLIQDQLDFPAQWQDQRRQYFDHTFFHSDEAVSPVIANQIFSYLKEAENAP